MKIRGQEGRRAKKTKMVIRVLGITVVVAMVAADLFAMAAKPQPKAGPPPAEKEKPEEVSVEEVTTTEEEVKEEEKKKPRPVKKSEDAIKEKIRDIELVPR